MQKDFLKLAEAYGWQEIESKNPYMHSLKGESGGFEYRMNVYNTGKIQIQPIGVKHSSGAIFTAHTLEEFEDVLMKYK